MHCKTAEEVEKSNRGNNWPAATNGLMFCGFYDVIVGLITLHFTWEDGWRDAREKKKSGNCAAFGEEKREKNEICILIFISCRS